MKKYILSILSLLFLNTTYSQVLYDDNFDNYTLGNLGTDTNGVTPGQGGWFILSHYSKNNNLFSVRNDLPQGNKVLVLSCPPSNYEVLAIEKRSLNTLIDQRKSGNDVLKFEIDFFTGHSGFDHSNVIMLSSSLNNSITDHDKSTILATLRFIQGGIECWVHNQSGTGHYRPLNHSYSPYVKVDLPYNTWIKFIIYLDYPNKKIYYETPYLGTVVAFDFLVNRKNGDSIEDNKPNLLQIRNDGQDIINSYMYNKYDNIKITALNAVPPHILSVNTILAESFNLYPNPATNVVNITNSENHLVNQVVIYDVAGKELSTQTFNNKSEILLNVENLASGVYLLHIETKEGTAVKKLIKK